ncbi:MAG: 30S ribosomal protein S20 [Calditrichaeota bacterium]|nr:MAG: 30S ribosomal protein S20 [Calditrichota bacterium]
MAHHKSAIKRIRTSLKERAYNRHYKKQMRLAIKAVLNSDNKEQAATELKNAYKIIDRLAAKNIIHKNNAANKKARLARFVNKMA